MSGPRSLVEALFGEVYQTERSAVRHCAVEADRLGVTPPAEALRAVSAHAARAEREIEEHARRRGLTESSLGTLVGSLFSRLRDDLADFTLTAEQSYRGTLLGMRHGCDVFALLGSAAAAEGDEVLRAWCAGWLDERRPLVEACARELAWFGRHPDRALENAKVKAEPVLP